MRHPLLFIATFFLITCNSVFAQVDTCYINTTKNYVKYVDSINKLDYVQDIGFMTSIAEGTIKVDNKVVGGFGVYTLSNLKGDTAFRIEYHDNVNINTYKTYYFKSDKLIYANIEFKSADSKEKTLFRKEEFYKDGELMWANPQTNPSKYFDMTNFSLFIDGQKFLAAFKKDNNRR